MLRGLIIRQAFVLVDVALVALLLLVGYVWFLKIFEPEGTGSAVVAGPDSEGGSAIQMASVGDRSDYDVIAKNGFLGRAGATNNIPEAPPPPGSGGGPTVENKDLILLATVATYPTDPLAGAVIKDKRTNAEKTYYMNQPVTADVTLLEVHKRKVILLNKKKNNQRETLRMEEPEQEGGSTAPKTLSPTASRRSVGRPDSKVVTIKKAEIYKQLSEDNYAEVALQLSPQLHKDANGKIDGITSSNLEKNPLAQEMGLKNGDIVQKVNNVAIDSEKKLMQIVGQFQHAKVIKVSILRNGKPQLLTIRIE